MPELPEVETVRLGLNQITSSYAPQITDVVVLLESTIASGEFFIDHLRGQYLQSWQRRGKYLLCSLSGGGHLGVHLRMTGRLLWLDRSQPQGKSIGKHTRVRLFLDHDRELRFDDQRTFGKMWFVPQGVAISQVITGLQGMGAEPLSADFTPDYLAQKLRTSNRSIKTLLLDQTVVAGIGNIYADEALFLARIHPRTQGKNLDLEQIEVLQRSIVAVLETGLQYGGTTFSNFQDVNGAQGNYLDRAWVFRRTGADCRVCGSKIQRLKIGGRSSHFCATCQG